jgi:alpha-beta hydrolase superfamily lysophospholipase
MLLKIGLFALISLSIYLGIAAGLILSNPPQKAVPSTGRPDPIDFTTLITADYANIPGLQPYTARDQATLYYRQYSSQAPTHKVLVLLHGSGWHSMQFHPLAAFVSQHGLAHVITPDLRGHGFSPQVRGDVAYVGQLEDDLADLLAEVRQQHPGAQIIVGGHSSGGGLAIRFAGSRYGSQANAYLLLAPFLKYNAPTTQPNSGGWARPLSRRIAGLSMLNQLGVRWLNHLTVIQFAMPQAVLEGPLGDSATTAYSYRLNTSFAPRSHYGRDLAALQQPFLLAAGLDDQAFIATQYEPGIAQFTPSGSYVLLPGVGHVDLLTTPQLEPRLVEWLSSLP